MNENVTHTGDPLANDLHCAVVMPLTAERRGQAPMSFMRAGVFALALVAMPAMAQAPTSAEVPDEFPHVSFGDPARIATTTVDASLGATVVTFTTGARLIVKSTHSTPGQFSVIASFGAGRSGVPDSLVHALWATTLFPIGGTTKFSYADLDLWQKTSGHPVNVTFVPAVAAFQLQGDAPSSELRNELALLTAYVRDPGFGPELAEKIATIGPMIATQIEGDPAADFARGVQHILVGPRYQELPERMDIEATTGKELPGLLTASLAMAADVAVVGDISVEDAIRAMAETLAAGDHRPIARQARAVVMPPTSGRGSIVFEHLGAEADAWFGEYWHLPDYAIKPHLSIVAEVAAAIIEDRLRREPTTAPSLAAPPVVSVSAPIELKGQAAFGIALKITPLAVTAARNRIARIIAELAHGPIESEAVKRASLAVISGKIADQNSNVWWAHQLTLVLRDPSLAPVMPQASDITSITPAGVSDFLKTYLIGRRPVVVAALPAGTSNHSRGSR